MSEDPEGMQALWVALPESGESAAEVTTVEADMRGLALGAGWLYFVARCAGAPELDHVVRLRL